VKKNYWDLFFCKTLYIFFQCDFFWFDQRRRYWWFIWFYYYVGLQQVTTHVCIKHLYCSSIVLVSFQCILQRRSGRSVLGILTVYSVGVLQYNNSNNIQVVSSVQSLFIVPILKNLKQIIFCEQRPASILYFTTF